MGEAVGESSRGSHRQRSPRLPGQGCLCLPATLVGLRLGWVWALPTSVRAPIAGHPLSMHSWLPHDLFIKLFSLLLNIFETFLNAYSKKTKEWRKQEILGKRKHKQVSTGYRLIDGQESLRAILPILVLWPCAADNTVSKSPPLLCLEPSHLPQETTTEGMEYCYTHWTDE